MFKGATLQTESGDSDRQHLLKMAKPYHYKISASDLEQAHDGSPRFFERYLPFMWGGPVGVLGAIATAGDSLVLIGSTGLQYLTLASTLLCIPLLVLQFVSVRNSLRTRLTTDPSKKSKHAINLFSTLASLALTAVTAVAMVYFGALLGAAGTWLVISTCMALSMYRMFMRQEGRSAASSSRKIGSFFDKIRMNFSQVKLALVHFWNDFTFDDFEKSWTPIFATVCYGLCGYVGVVGLIGAALPLLTSAATYFGVTLAAGFAVTYGIPFAGGLGALALVYCFVSQEGVSYYKNDEEMDPDALPEVVTEGHLKAHQGELPKLVLRWANKDFSMLSRFELQKGIAEADRTTPEQYLSTLGTAIGQ